MNRILEQSHLRKNTNLLRARDYWFDRARRLGRLGLYLGIVPTILLIVSYFPIPGVIDFMDEYRDFVIAAISIALFFVGLKISNTSDEYRGMSNEFREVYDLNVLGVPRNPFILTRHANEPERTKAMYDEGVRKYRDHPKYEAWYEEVFSDNHNANVICCQMDNALYTYHIYKEAVRLYWGLTIALLAIVIVPALLLRNPATMLLIFIATFDLLVTFLEAINDMRGQQGTLAGMRDVVLGEDLDLDDDVACGIFIRETQDAIAAYREVSAFVPRFIRDKYLREDSPYYKDLNAVKARLYKGLEITRPETDDQITTFGEGDDITGTLADAHDVLRRMLADIIPVLEEGGVRYALDGGSLIGAVRENENHRFVFWDDDIDLALDVRDVELAERLVREGVGRLIPSVNLRNVIRVYAGTRTAVGNDFIIEESKKYKNYFMLLGICSPGLTSAPAIGEYVAGQAAAALGLVKKQQTIPLPDRFHLTKASEEEIKQKVASDPTFGRIVCRCEKVTEGEILAAIRSPLPARTVDAVKRRVRAGMGRCQGGFCRPRVMEILSREFGIPLSAVRLGDKGSEIAPYEVKDGYEKI